LFGLVRAKQIVSTGSGVLMVRRAQGMEWAQLGSSGSPEGCRPRRPEHDVARVRRHKRTYHLGLRRPPKRNLGLSAPHLFPYFGVEDTQLRRGRHSVWSSAADRSFHHCVSDGNRSVSILSAVPGGVCGIASSASVDFCQIGHCQDNRYWRQGEYYARLRTLSQR
jgi:hypothetical protein